MNISSDKILLVNQGKKDFLDRNNLERALPKVLNNLYRSNPFEEIFVLNGPGSFTSLRISTLSINLLNFVFKDNFKIFTISKPEFYKKFIVKGFLPNLGIIYIGQKKNFWLYDFSIDKYHQINISDIQNIKDDYFVDQVFGEIGQIFDQNKIVDIDFQNNEFIINYNGNIKKMNTSDFALKSDNEMKPNYMIEPNIS